MVVKGE